MIKSNGNLKPKPFLKTKFDKASDSNTGSKSIVLKAKEVNFLSKYIANKFPEFPAIKDKIAEKISGFLEESFYLIKFKGNNHGSFVEYSYYLIPVEAVLNCCYRTKTRNNLILELNPNYIFDEDYVSNFIGENKFDIDNEIIPTVIIDNSGQHILIDFHSYINTTLYTKKYTKTNLDVNDYRDGKYPVILKGSRGNSSHFEYMAHIVIKTHEVCEGIFNKQGYIFDYNLEIISDLEELSFDRILL